MRYCDLCDTPAGLIDNMVRGFCSCDFDLCSNCFPLLPDKNEKVPLHWSPAKLWPLSLVNDDDSDDSDWKEE